MCTSLVNHAVYNIELTCHWIYSFVVIPVTVHLFIFKKPRDFVIWLLLDIAHGRVRGEVCFCELQGLFKTRPPFLSSVPWRIQFRNCADLWTTAAVLCQRPLETVQRTIKVIGSEWGEEARLKIVFRSHTSASTHRMPIPGNDILCHTNWPCGCAYRRHWLQRGSFFAPSWERCMHIIMIHYGRQWKIRSV